MAVDGFFGASIGFFGASTAGFFGASTGFFEAVVVGFVTAFFVGGAGIPASIITKLVSNNPL